eukprot:gene18222-biopygen21933
MRNLKSPFGEDLWCSDGPTGLPKPTSHPRSKDKRTQSRSLPQEEMLRPFRCLQQREELFHATTRPAAAGAPPRPARRGPKPPLPAPSALGAAHITNAGGGGGARELFFPVRWDSVGYQTHSFPMVISGLPRGPMAGPWPVRGHWWEAKLIVVFNLSPESVA